MTAPGDCLKRLVLARFQPVALIGWRARAFNSSRESVERHRGILLLRVLVANREIVGADSDDSDLSVAPVGTVEPRRSVATASSVPIKTPVTGVTVDAIGQFLISSGRLSFTARTFKRWQPYQRERASKRWLMLELRKSADETAGW